MKTMHEGSPIAVLKRFGFFPVTGSAQVMMITPFPIRLHPNWPYQLQTPSCGPAKYRASLTHERDSWLSESLHSYDLHDFGVKHIHIVFLLL